MRLKLKKIEVHELPYTEIVKSATITVDSPQSYTVLYEILRSLCAQRIRAVYVGYSQ